MKCDLCGKKLYLADSPVEVFEQEGYGYVRYYCPSCASRLVLAMLSSGAKVTRECEREMRAYLDGK